MKERIRHSGSTAREEMIIDGQNLLKEELEHDSSYSPTMYFWNPVLECDDRPANVRIYNRKYSSLNGNYQNFLTTYDNAIKIGDYLHDTRDDTYWIAYNSFNVNDVHYEGKLIQCNYLLNWQLPDGSIVRRWANIVSASKYDVGENGNHTIILSSNNYTILIGYCDEGFALDGKRVFIDMNPINPKKVFKITRSDDVLYNSGNMGALLSFIADKTEFNPDTDNQEIRICDYMHTALPPISPDESPVLSATISGSEFLKNGYERTYTVSFNDPDGNTVDWHSIDYQWEIISDFHVQQNQYENKIGLCIEDERLIGSSFLLCIKINNEIVSKLNITVVE